MKTSYFNKRGQIQSVIFAVALFFALGFVAFTFGDLIFRLFDGMDTALEQTTLNATLQHQAVRDFAEFNAYAWDQITLAIMIGILISLFITSYLTRVSPIFYWLYIILTIFIIIGGSLFSQAWDIMISQDIYTQTVQRYPITNAIFGSNFVYILLALFVSFVIIMIFGKRGGEDAIR